MAANASSPMSDSRCRSLNKLLPDLEAKLIVDNIKSHLHIDAGGFLNEVEVIEVFSGGSRVEHVRSLFSVLKTKDNAAFGSFCLVLSNSGYGHWSKALMEEAGLDHDFKATPELEKAKVNAILCKRRKMFKLTFKDIRSGFNKCRNELLSILKQLPPEDFRMFMISFNDSLRGVKKNPGFEQSDMESSLSVFTALSLQEMYTQFDLEVFDVMAECLSEDPSKKFTDALDNYKDNVLRPLLEKTLSALTGDAEVISTHDDQKKQLSLAFVVPDDATFGTLMKAKRYLEEEMEIHEVSNMRFDFNCITVLFDIACPPGNIEELAKRFLSDKHLQEMKKLNITDVFLLSHWAVVVADASICYFDESTSIEVPIPTKAMIVSSPQPGVNQSKKPSVFQTQRYTITIIGCSGRGKSTFCNFLFKEKRFDTQDSRLSGFFGWGGLMSTPSKAQHGVVVDECTGIELHIIDTPGYLATQHRMGHDQEDMAKDDKMILEEFARALMYAKDGIDAIFITLKAGNRVSREEELLMRFIEDLRLWDNCVLLFTHGYCVGDKEDDRYRGFRELISTSEFQKNCPVLAKMLEMTKNRYMIVESVQLGFEDVYCTSKLEEISSIVDAVLGDHGAIVDHPMLRLARNSHKLYLKHKEELLIQKEEKKERREAIALESDVRSREMEVTKVKTDLCTKEEKLEIARGSRTDREKGDDEEIRRLRLDLQAKESELATAKAEIEKKNAKIDSLIDNLEHQISTSPDSDPGPIKLLVNYLRRLDDDSEKFTDSYSQLEKMTEEQKAELEVSLKSMGSVEKSTSVVAPMTQQDGTTLHRISHPIGNGSLASTREVIQEEHRRRTRHWCSFL